MIIKIESELTAARFKDYSSELVTDLVDAFSIYQEYALQTITDSLEADVTMAELEERIGNLKIDIPKKDVDELVAKAFDFRKKLGPKAIKSKLKKFINKFSWEDGNIKTLVGKIYGGNSEKVQESSLKDFEKKTKASTGKVKEKKIIMPELNVFAPDVTKEVKLRKIQGEKLSEDFRDSLLLDLRESMNEAGVTQKRGRFSGQQKKDLTTVYEKKITKRFEGYVKKNPKYKMPTNIHNIAVTEVRNAVSKAQEQYYKKFQKDNKIKKAFKTWIQHKNLSKVPRVSHALVHGKKIATDALFSINSEEGLFDVFGPHDNKLPLGEKIGCHCELVYTYEI